jgi:hypothetical protein
MTSKYGPQMFLLPEVSKPVRHGEIEPGLRCSCNLVGNVDLGNKLKQDRQTMRCSPQAKGLIEFLGTGFCPVPLQNTPCGARNA